jgi:hypothetical protein
MNGRERLALAMRHAPPDRVPVMCQLALGHYFLNAGLPPHEVWFTSEGFAAALVQLQQRYRFDGILINIPGRPADILAEVDRLERTAEGEVIRWRNGTVTLVPWDENARLESVAGDRPLRADFDTIDPDRLDVLDDLPGYIWNTYHIPWLAGKQQPGPLSAVPDYFFRTIDLVRQKVGAEVSIHGEVFSPFTHYLELFGYENALMSLIVDAGKAEALLDRLAGASVAWAVAQAERGVDAVLISSAFAGAGLISPGMYERFVVPFERRVTAAVRALGVPVYTHTCGRIGDRLELMEATGTQGIDTLDPPPLGNVALAEAKRRVGERMFLKGNLDSVALLAYETPEQVTAEAAERLRFGKPGGGYVLSTACSVAPHVQPWKLELLAPLAEDLGRYP